MISPLLSTAFLFIYLASFLCQRFVNPNPWFWWNTVRWERVSYCIFTKAFIYPSECFIIIAEIDGRLDSTSIYRFSIQFDIA